MYPSMCLRRNFLTAACAAAGTALLPRSALSSPQTTPAPANSRGATPPIGCFGNVVFGKFRLDDDAMLDAVRAAGYEGLELYSPVGPRAAGAAPPTGNPQAAAGPTPEILATFKEKLAARGLTTTVGNLSLGGRGASLSEAIAAARQSVRNAHTLGQKFVLTLGTEDETQYIQFCKVLSNAAAFGRISESR